MSKANSSGCESRAVFDRRMPPWIAANTATDIAFGLALDLICPRSLIRHRPFSMTMPQAAKLWSSWCRASSEWAASSLASEPSGQPPKPNLR
jgi:hypothetical protein